MPLILNTLLMTLLAVPFGSWAALHSLAGRSPEGFEDAGGFHFGLMPALASEGAGVLLAFEI